MQATAICLCESIKRTAQSEYYVSKTEYFFYFLYFISTNYSAFETKKAVPIFPFSSSLLHSCLCLDGCNFSYVYLSIFCSSTSAAEDTRIEQQVNRPNQSSAPTLPPSGSKVCRQWVLFGFSAVILAFIIVVAYTSIFSGASSRNLNFLLPVNQDVRDKNWNVNRFTSILIWCFKLVKLNKCSMLHNYWKSW